MPSVLYGNYPLLACTWSLGELGSGAGRDFHLKVSRKVFFAFSKLKYFTYHLAKVLAGELGIFKLSYLSPEAIPLINSQIMQLGNKLCSYRTNIQFLSDLLELCSSFLVKYWFVNLYPFDQSMLWKL